MVLTIEKRKIKFGKVDLAIGAYISDGKLIFSKEDTFESSIRLLTSDIGIDSKGQLTILIVNRILNKKEAEDALDFLNICKHNILNVFFKKIESHCLSILKSKSAPNKVPSIMFKK